MIVSDTESTSELLVVMTRKEKRLRLKYGEKKKKKNKKGYP